MEWRSSEHAYQAAKSLNRDERIWVQQAPDAGAAKKRGRQLDLRPDWDDVKDEVMYDVLTAKFSTQLRKDYLVGTHPAILVEGNWWHDQYWGDCYCDKHKDTPGRNNLGLSLMRLRKELMK